MATSEQIDAAARQPKPTKGDGFVDRKAHHILGGAFTGAGTDHASVSRLLAREAPDVAEIVGIDLPDGDPDLASALVGLVARGRPSHVRGWIGDCDRAEISGIRAALAARRRDR